MGQFVRRSSYFIVGWLIVYTHVSMWLKKTLETPTVYNHILSEECFLKGGQGMLLPEAGKGTRKTRKCVNSV